MDYQYEKEAIAEGFTTVCGIDEAGRGPLCGPVCAAAVILPLDCEIEGINDSKIPVLIAHGNNDPVISFSGQSVISHRAEIRKEKNCTYEQAEQVYNDEKAKKDMQND